MNHAPTLRICAALLPLLLAACAQGSEGKQTDTEKAQMQMAAGLKQGGHIDEAISVYSKVAAEEKTSVEGHLELASLLRKTGHGNEAVAVMQDAGKIDAKNPRVLSGLGYSLVSAGKGAEAQAVFKQWAEQDPKNFAPLAGEGVALDSMGDHAAAQSVYRTALGMTPTDVNKLQNNLAMSLILSGHYDEAILLLEPLVQSGGTQTTRQNLALAYGLKGDKKRALAMNLKDLPPAKAKENMRFYEEYKKRLKKGGNVTPPSRLNKPTEDEPAVQAAPVAAVSSK